MSALNLISQDALLPYSDKCFVTPYEMNTSSASVNVRTWFITVLRIMSIKLPWNGMSIKLPWNGWMKRKGCLYGVGKGICVSLSSVFLDMPMLSLVTTYFSSCIPIHFEGLMSPHPNTQDSKTFQIYFSNGLFPFFQT